ncbi:hypothetical protein [Allostreptomyces psammosilenae]|uniref:Uncharacterized protein n=1 Tax=Allostreptomyces psammosilenae TaxID=1892865 RepID=A0A852ZTA4_9ACTN|nr:hypothetical protein [Allostreptomyces psammosilenae]NYI05569.1 hypothetical protein [Allostreptomyces psammosilenae]
MTAVHRLLTTLGRLQFALMLAGVAWLLGYQPGPIGRTALAVAVALLLAPDATGRAARRHPWSLRRRTAEPVGEVAL